MGSLAIDRIKNQSPGKRGTGKESIYFNAGSDSSSSTYDVTLNYDTGHFCSCRGMLSKIRKHGAVGSLNARQPLSISGPPMHWCKHIKAVRSAPAEFRIEARKMRNEFFGISETPVDPETGRSGEPEAPVGRRAAIKATHVKRAARGDQDAVDRLAAIEAEREALLAEIEADKMGVELRKGLDELIQAHGESAVKAATASLVA
jgi:hypothetical protein